MTDLPFGFQPSNPGDDPREWAAKAPLFAELAKLMSWQGGPVNWDLARQLAISQIGDADPTVTGADNDTVAEALRLADLWLDEHTSLPSGTKTTAAWTRVQWVEQTIGVWQRLCDPVAAKVVETMGTTLPDEVKAQAGPLLPVLNQAGGLMFGAQIGEALGALAADVVGSTDIGLPLGPAGEAALLPANLTAFGEGLERPAEEVRLYLALRETAHHRLFGHIPWLRGHLLAAVDAYAKGITVDREAIERAMADLDPTDPESMQKALAGGMFEPQNTEAQQQALTRLETALALVEGWVDTVVTDAAGTRLEGAAALGETLRRRRATGGPAEQTFATLVGLELRPRRLREAAALWRAVTERHGASGRDRLWSHPDLLPGADDFDDPAGFAERAGEDEDPPALPESPDSPES
ncbi:MAG: zinc-dependent metalloprotease [Mycobacteriales bacterium]